jgi:1,3-beta-glucan synthase
MKQTKLRRRRVIRYAILYFVMLVVFLALLVGPVVAGRYVPASVFKPLNDLNMGLVQPEFPRNDTHGRTATGTGAKSYTGVMASELSAKATATAANRMMI